MSELENDCSWHTSKVQLKTYCASRQNVQVRIDVTGILDSVKILISDGTKNFEIGLSRDEMICLNKVVSNYIKELI